MSVKRNLIANYLGQGWTAIMSLIFIPVYIRYLGVEAYALIGVFASLQAWLALLDMGLAPTLNREMARFAAGAHTSQSIRNLLFTLEVLFLGVATAIFVGVLLLSSWLAVHWLNPQALSVASVGEALSIMGLVIALRWMTSLYRSAILGLQRQVLLNVCAASFATLRGAGVIAVLAFVAPTIQAFFYFQAALAVVESITLCAIVRYSLPPPPAWAQFSFDALRDVWRFAAGMTTITALATLLTQVDKLLLAKLLPLKDFGYFTLATTVAGALSVLIGPIINVAYPRFTTLVTNKDEPGLAAQYHKFAKLLSITVIPPTLLLCLFPMPILLLWTRDAATSSAVAPILSIWVVGTALNGFMHVPYMAQLAHGWARLTVIVNTLAVALIIPAFLILVPRWGVLAAAWIWVVINVGYLVFSVGFMHRRILKAEKWVWYSQDIGIPLISALAVSAITLLALHVIAPGAQLATALVIGLGGLAALLAAAASTGLLAPVHMGKVSNV